MKKLYILTAFLTLIGFGASAQCTPDMSYTELGVYPSAIGSICEGDDINQTLTIVAPNETTIDTDYGSFSFQIDTVWIKEVNNLPENSSYKCETTDCYLVTKDAINYSCINVKGTNLPAYDSSVEIVLKVKAYNSLAGSQTLDSTFNIPLTINSASSSECIATSVNDFDFSENDLSIYPNPVNSASSVFINLATNEYAQIELYNIVGEKKATIYNGNLTSGNNKISLANKVESLDKGIYLLKVNLPESNNSYMKRIIVQ